MIRALDIAKTGLNVQQTNLDVIANNLSNASTNGFKGQKAVFEDLIYQNLRQAGAQSSQQTQIAAGLQLGTGAQAIATATNFNMGDLEKTSNQFNVAINGDGFFQVLLPDGTLGYTRDGSFTLDSTGQLVNSSGYPVQPAIGPIVSGDVVTIDTSGNVTITRAGATAGTFNIQLATFVNQGGLQRIGQNLFRETVASGAPTPNAPGSNGAGSVLQNYLETSNVKVTDELISMIQTQRAYELNSKVVSTADAMLGRLTQL